MICKIVDVDENLPYGHTISIPLEEMCNRGYQLTKYNLFRNACLLQEAESVEETDWILSMYEELKANGKIVMLNIDANVEIPNYGNKVPNNSYGYWLVSGEKIAHMNWDWETGDVRSVLYKVLYNMLIDEGFSFIEIRIGEQDGQIVYHAIQHCDGSDTPITTFGPIDFDEEDTYGGMSVKVVKFVDEYLN